MTGAVLEGEADIVTGAVLDGDAVMVAGAALIGAVEIRRDGFGVEIGDGFDGDDGTG